MKCVRCKLQTNIKSPIPEQTPLPRFRHCIIGGGIVGLAIAAKLSHFGSTLLLEKNRYLLNETSSHNSGVVHSGIYYPVHSLKTKLCVEGNHIIWDILKKQQNEEKRTAGRILARQCGKWICATASPGTVEYDQECAKLHQISETMKVLDLPCRFLSAREAQNLEPNVKTPSLTILESPRTGIIDVHSFGNYFVNILNENRFFNGNHMKNKHFFVGKKATTKMVEEEENENLVMTSCEVTKIHFSDSLFRVETSDGGGEIATEYLINAAGLYSNHVAKLLQVDDPFGGREEKKQRDKLVTVPTHHQLYFCKGRYARYQKAKGAAPIVSRLVYPCPLPNLKGLGVHSVLDCSGELKFGPDAVYVASPSDYSLFTKGGNPRRNGEREEGEGKGDQKNKVEVEEEEEEKELLTTMYEAVKRYLPCVERSRFHLDFAGIRPKLSNEGEPFRDFVIEKGVVCTSSGGEREGKHADPFLEKFINLVGIESPGLTASPAIADYVSTELIGYPPMEWN